jgi:hypothetical protein
MPLWYLGASPSEDTSLATVGYVNSLSTQSLSDADVRQKIKDRFSLVAYATAPWAEGVINSTLTGQAFARQTDLTSAFAAKIPVLGTLKSRANGPVALDSSGMVDPSLITKASTQTFPRLHWSPSSYPVRSNVTTETNISTITVNPSLANYRVFVTGTINAKITADGQHPVVRVRANNTTTGDIVATGHGLGESHGGGIITTYSTPGNHTYSIPGWATRIDIIVIGGGGGGINAPISTGYGGGAGLWAGRTIIKSQLPANTITLPVAVGSGASNADYSLFPSAYGFGGNTVCTVPGTGESSGTLTGAGGKTGNNQVAVGATLVGSGAQNFPFGNNTYTGSLNQTSPGAKGNAPGGGGAGGSSGPGGSGGDGAAFFYAYVDDDTNYGQINVIPASVSPVLTGTTTLYVNVLRSSTSASVTTSSLNPQISVMVVPA